jgi:hypothetical protein
VTESVIAWGKIVVELNKHHPFYRLSAAIDWSYLELNIKQAVEIEKTEQFRLVTGLLYVKAMKKLSSKEVLDLWLVCPQLRYFCGDDLKETPEAIPYYPGVLDMWDREYAGKPYDSMTYALYRTNVLH